MPKAKVGKEKKSNKNDANILPIDENQLRRDLRDIIKSKQSEKQRETIEMSLEDKPGSVDDLRIGGIEGGGTHSTLIIMNGRGKQLTQVKGPGTNHWCVGMKETASRLNEMITRAKRDCEIPENRPLDCVGLCLSGCEEEGTNKQLVDTLLQEYPAASREYVVGSDTIGSISTGVANGGVVLIAGTGSNALLVNPDGKTHGCGGWGYMMGDEGSAYWIAHRAFKYVFDDIDGLVPSPYPTSYVWPAMKDFFKVADRSAMLPHIYADFEKSKIALFAKELYVGCEKNDPLCKLIFEDNGKYLAKHVNALGRKAHNDLKLCAGGLKVICVGSVWKSWDFMRNGFIQEIVDNKVVDELTLATLTVSSALGACYRASEKINCDSVEKNYEMNTNDFYHYKRDDTPIDDINRSLKNIGTEINSVCKRIFPEV